MTAYLVVGLAAAAASCIATIAVRRTVVRLGAFDVPRDRKVHRAPTPSFGGVALYIGFAVALGTAAAFADLREALEGFEVLGLVAGGLIVLVVGLVDDVRHLSVAKRFMAQIAAAFLLFVTGSTMSFLWFPFVGTFAIGPEISVFATVFWVVLLTNAINFIDGLDGLAAGLTAIAALGVFLYSVRLPSDFLGPHPIAPIIAIALAGACVGFLPHNFNPARIIMGDTGAMPLGFFLAAATVSMVGRFEGPGDAGGRLALPLIFTPVIFLAVPLTNIAFAVIRRLVSGRTIFAADQEHIHYHLLRLGHSHRRAVLTLYGWALVTAGALVIAGTMPWGRFLLASAVAGGIVMVMTAAPPVRQMREGRLAERRTEPV